MADRESDSLTDRLTYWQKMWLTKQENWLSYKKTDWLPWEKDLLTDPKANWLTERLTDRMTDWQKDGQKDLLSERLPEWLTYWQKDWLTHRHTYTQTYWQTHILIDSFWSLSYIVNTSSLLCHINMVLTSFQTKVLKESLKFLGF